MKTPLVHENLGKLLPAVFRDWRATPPFKRFRVLCGVFSLFIVATRRRTAGGALCLPPSPRVLVSPLPQKSHTASRVAIFGDPVIFKGTLIFMGKNSPSSQKPYVCGYLGALLAATHEAGFSQCPIVHCSLPPWLRRLVHENLATLRFSVRYSDLSFIIISRASKTTLLR